MDQFKREVFPLISEHGLSLGEALILFKLNEISNHLSAMRDALEDSDPS